MTPIRSTIATDQQAPLSEEQLEAVTGGLLPSGFIQAVALISSGGRSSSGTLGSVGTRRAAPPTLVPELQSI